MSEQKLRELEPQRPGEQGRLVEKNLVEDVFGKKAPTEKPLEEAQRGDVVLIRGQKCIVLEVVDAERRGQREKGILILRDIDGVVYTCSYFVSDLK